MAKSSSLSERISGEIRERGPLTVAAFMERALYDSEAGYYARAARRTGRAGDFFPSVDVGPFFGELLGMQMAEMLRLVARGVQPRDRGPHTAVLREYDLVEAAAGNGRLAADILDAMQRRDRALYDRVRLHLVERSARARAAQPEVLGPHAARLASSSPALPDSFEGVLIANELLDAMPVHQVVMRHDGLREVYVAADGDCLSTCEGPLSTTAIDEYLRRIDVALEPCWRAEVNLNAVAWVRDAARRLRRGFIVVIDYGHEARALYSAAHGGGTLTTFAGHRLRGAESPGRPAWLDDPGEQDITAHVDFTSVRAAAEAEGLETVGLMDQTYFLMGIAGAASSDLSHLDPQHRLMFKTLIAPGGLGSTMKVLILGRDVDARQLSGCSYGMRLT